MNIETLIQTLDTPANAARVTTRGKGNKNIVLDFTFTSELIGKLRELPDHAKDHFDLALVWDSCAVLMKGDVKIHSGSEDRLILTTEERLVTILADGEVVDFNAEYNRLVQFEFGGRLNQFDPRGLEGTSNLARFLRERTTVTA